MHFLKSLRRWIQCQCQSQLYINGQYDIRLVDRKEIVFYCVQRQAVFSLGVMTIGGSLTKESHTSQVGQVNT